VVVVFKLRKLPSTPLPLADQLSVCIFLVTAPPAFAAAMAGPDAVTQWDWLAAGLLATLLLTVGLVVLGVKGPALLQELAQDAPPWALSWLRVYREPSLLCAPPTVSRPRVIGGRQTPSRRRHRTHHPARRRTPTPPTDSAALSSR
jgi:hypothetical protein